MRPIQSRGQIKLMYALYRTAIVTECSAVACTLVLKNMCCDMEKNSNADIDSSINRLIV